MRRGHTPFPVDGFHPRTGGRPCWCQGLSTCPTPVKSPLQGGTASLSPRKCRPMVHNQSAMEPCGGRCVSEAGTRNGLRCRGHLHSHGPAPNARRSQPPIESCWSRSLCQQPIYTHGVRLQLQPTGQEGSLQGAPGQAVQEETMSPCPDVVMTGRGPTDCTDISPVTVGEAKDKVRVAGNAGSAP